MIASPNATPAGYKQTELGVIPNSWAVAELQSVCGQTITYGIVQCGPHIENGVPYIRVSDMSNRELDVSAMLRTSPALAAQFSRSTVRQGEIVYAMRGIIGEVRQVPADVDGANLTQGTARISPNDRVHAGYLLWALRSQSSLRQGHLEAKGSTFREITLAEIRRIGVPIPPLVEQQAIAEALGDADALIESLEQLVAKKRHLKQAAMQQLLTGKKRLPGFEGDWEKKRLGELGYFLKGSGVKKDDAQSGTRPCVWYGEIYTRHDDYVRRFFSWISRDVATTATPLKKGDLLFAGSGETREEIGKCIAFVHDCEAYAGGDIVILRTNAGDSLFLGYYLNTGEISLQRASKGQGDAVVHISASALSDIECTLPDASEQAAIAEVLSDMDADIAATEAKLSKARQIKQGMMQELLTGRTRLV